MYMWNLCDISFSKIFRLCYYLFLCSCNVPIPSVFLCTEPKVCYRVNTHCSWNLLGQTKLRNFYNSKVKLSFLEGCACILRWDCKSFFLCRYWIFKFDLHVWNFTIKIRENCSRWIVCDKQTGNDVWPKRRLTQ
jgi:hypothetical protein